MTGTVGSIHPRFNLHFPKALREIRVEHPMFSPEFIIIEFTRTGQDGNRQIMTSGRFQKPSMWRLALPSRSLSILPNKVINTPNIFKDREHFSWTLKLTVGHVFRITNAQNESPKMGRWLLWASASNGSSWLHHVCDCVPTNIRTSRTFFRGASLEIFSGQFPTVHVFSSFLDEIKQAVKDIF
jgi:hypothetical protein